MAKEKFSGVSKGLKALFVIHGVFSLLSSSLFG